MISAKAPQLRCYLCTLRFFDLWTLTGHLVIRHGEIARIEKEL